MTIYNSPNFTEDWKMARRRQTIAGDDETEGNLSFRTNTSKDKKESPLLLEEWKDMDCNEVRGLQLYLPREVDNVEPCL